MEKECWTLEELLEFIEIALRDYFTVTIRHEPFDGLINGAYVYTVTCHKPKGVGLVHV